MEICHYTIILCFGFGCLFDANVCKVIWFDLLYCIWYMKSLKHSIRFNGSAGFLLGLVYFISVMSSVDLGFLPFRSEWQVFHQLRFSLPITKLISCGPRILASPLSDAFDVLVRCKSLRLLMFASLPALEWNENNKNNWSIDNGDTWLSVISQWPQCSRESHNTSKTHELQ